MNTINILLLCGTVFYVVSIIWYFKFKKKDNIKMILEGFNTQKYYWAKFWDEKEYTPIRPYITDSNELRFEVIGFGLLFKKNAFENIDTFPIESR